MIEGNLSNQLIEVAKIVVAENISAKRMIATAESCTGGLVSGTITEIAGSSAVFDRAFITYSNSAKKEMLDVPSILINSYGAVSIKVAESMAIGAIKNSYANIAVSITGIAGPSGASVEKPIGTVAFALANKNGVIKSILKQFNPKASRSEIRYEATIYALNLLRP